MKTLCTLLCCVILSGTFTDNCTAISTISSPDTLILHFKPGWNIFSANVMPDSADLKFIIRPLINSGTLVKIQDENGNALEDFGALGGWTNNIGNLSLTEGYKIKVNDFCQLVITGKRTSFPFTFSIKSGWNIMSYPYNSEIDGQVIVQKLIDNKTLVKIQDENGNSIEDFGILGGWTNNIGDFYPGKGYKIKVTQNEIILHPFREKVTPTGSKIFFSGDKLSYELIIPPNTFTKNEIITLSENNPGYDDIFQASHFSPLGNSIKLEYTDSVFNHPVSLIFHYTQDIITDPVRENELQLVYLDENDKSLVVYERSAHNSEENTYQIDLDHFSVFSIGYWNFKWDIPIIHYYFGEDKSGILWGGESGPYEKINLAMSAVEVWRNYESEFDLVRTNDPNEAEINITSATIYDTDQFGLTNVGFIKIFSNTKVDVKMYNTAGCNYLIPNFWTKSLTHEVGHALGLTHFSPPAYSPCLLPNSQDISSLPMMGTLYENCPTFNKREITQCDIDKLHAIYSPLTCTDVEGNSYKVVRIGNQIWMAENLRTTKYQDGYNIPNVTDNNDWSNLITGAFCWHSNNVTYKNTYGALYNWYAVNSGKLCPNGWHVPGDSEWTILTSFLGGVNIAGGKMKSVTGWHSPNTGATNESGFSALPGGARADDGAFDGSIGSSIGNWWSATGVSYSSAWKWSITYDSHEIYRNDRNKKAGWSIRCVKN
jgi:uncharacterized protein (TIGR02145 family)